MNIPTVIGIPIRAVVFTIAIACFGIYLAGALVYCAGCWWWEQVKG